MFSFCSPAVALLFRAFLIGLLQILHLGPEYVRSVIK